MERHGSESYFVIGEGLLGESRGGRQLAGCACAVAAVPPFRFSRMGPKGPGMQLGEPNGVKLAQAMTADNVSPGQIPAGFTYLGQFIDHDLTFDKTSVMLGDDIHAGDLLQGSLAEPRPRLALRRRPARSGVGEVLQGRRHPPQDGQTAQPAAPGDDGFDLPRGAGSRRQAQGRSSPTRATTRTSRSRRRTSRSSASTTASSTRCPPSLPAAQRFTEARKHRHEALPVDDPDRLPAADLRAGGRRRRVHATAARRSRSARRRPTSRRCRSSSRSPPTGSDTAWCAPVQLERGLPDGAGTLALLFDSPALSGDLGGRPDPPSIWIADFRRLYDFGEAGPSRPRRPAGEVQPRDANRHEARQPAGEPAAGRSADPGPRRPATSRSATCTRASMVKLATGQQMVDVPEEQGRDADRRSRRRRSATATAAPTLAALTAAQRDALLTNTPLWFYILREAELNDGRLHGVGARIVAETFHRAMEGSTFSIVRDTAFRPSLGPEQHHVPHGRPPVLRVRRQPRPAQPERQLAGLTRSPIIPLHG